MPPLIKTQPKTCLQCGESFVRGRLRSGRIEAIDDWRERKFCSHTCSATANQGEKHHYWRGGIKRRPDGYQRDSRTDKYIHRLVMEKHLGRELNSDEFVHHRDGDPTNNRLGNLEVLTNSQHAKLHAPLRRRINGAFAAGRLKELHA